MNRLYPLLVALVAAVVIVPSALAFGFTDGSLLPPHGKVGTPYSFQLNARNGCPPYAYHQNPGGQLPPGLSLSSSGLISGTPTTEGSWGFWAAVTDQCPGDSSERYMTITIDAGSPAPAPLVVTTSTLKAATTGVAYSVTLSASGGSALTWSMTAGSLPAGLKLSSNGSISGTPTTVGTSTFTVKVSDGSRSTTKQLSLQVIAPLAASAAPPRSGEVGRPFSAALTATGGIAPYKWSVSSGALPSGVTIDAANGTISGVPATAGSFPLKVAVADANGSSTTMDVTLSIRARLAIATKRLPTATVGRSYRIRLAFRGGVGPLTWTVVRGHLPRGLHLNAKTGLVTGTARTAGTFRVSVVVRDALGARALTALRFIVRP